MVARRLAALAVLAVAAASASATYVAKKPAPTPKPKCYANGERAIGAPGKPAVPYYPCCSGEQPRPKKMDYTYDAAVHWGEFCGGRGNVVVKKSSCYETGMKAIGAPGYPAVDYKPCCNSKSPREKKGAEIKTADDKWGLFCLGGAAKSPEPVVKTGKIRCAGAPGYPYVTYVDCGPKMKCAPSPKDGWGSFCLSVTSKDCYKAGDRNEGAYGYPNVPYLPCCSGKPNVHVKGQWGKFCPADSEPKKYVVVTAAPKTYKPVSTYKPVPTYKPTPPKCVKKGASCDLYGTKCCGDNTCSYSGYSYKCVSPPPKCVKKGASCDQYGTKCCGDNTCSYSGYSYKCVEPTPMPSSDY